jgi:nuclear pore complex protein Nup98-Nup96
LSGNLTTRELIKQQIELWRDTNVDQNLSKHRLKLFLLIAGLPIICINNKTINVCEHLDWKRSMAIHLWFVLISNFLFFISIYKHLFYMNKINCRYISHPTASITDFLDLYEASFFASTRKYSATPRPDYFENEFEIENSNDNNVYDLRYLLLKLYSTGNYSLEAILNPQTYTYDPLDYRLRYISFINIITNKYMVNNLF